MHDVTPYIVLDALSLTDTALVSGLVALALVLAGAAAVRTRAGREVGEVLYEWLEGAIQDMVTVDAAPLVPLVLTQWAFILAINLVGLVPGVGSPSRDLSVTLGLAIVVLGAGHAYGFRAQGFRYLRHYVQPNPLLLPFHVVGEISRTLSLALRLFGNMLSGQIVGAIVVALAGPLVPVPLMLLEVLFGVVQTYIFGVLTLVFTASAMEVAGAHVATAAQEAS